MPDVVFTVDQAKSVHDQAVPGHDRRHPDIRPDVDLRGKDRGSCAVSS